MSELDYVNDYVNDYDGDCARENANKFQRLKARICSALAGVTA